MAELSDSDKKILLGPNYKQKQAVEDAGRGVTDETRRTTAKTSFATQMIGGAAGIGVIALIMALTNYRSMGTPYSPALLAGCLVVMLASAAVVAWFVYSRRRLVTIA